MKKLLSLSTLVALSIGFSSCCSMFGSSNAGYRTDTRQVKTCHYDIVTEEVYTANPSGKGGMTETIEKKVPRYKTINRKIRMSCGSGLRFYCPEKDCNGTASESYLKRVTAQGPVGSPNIGLVPTMRKLAE